MHARIATFALAPGDRPAAGARLAELIALLRAQPGFLNAWFVINEQAAEGGSFSLWGSAEAAEGAMAGLGAGLSELLGGLAVATSVRKSFEVLGEA
jgi:hypothetical protein